jgi:predicted DNA-binding transcriptional regulator AlpA
MSQDILNSYGNILKGITQGWQCGFSTMEAKIRTGYLAQKLGVSQDTLCRWADKGLIPQPRRKRGKPHGWRYWTPREARKIEQFNALRGKKGLLIRRKQNIAR